MSSDPTHKGNSTMLKLLSLLKRKEGMSKDEFRQWITVDHVEFAKALPGLRKYTVNVTIDDDEFPYDAVNELWFDSEEAGASPRSPVSSAPQPEVTLLLTQVSVVHLKTTEHVQF